MRDFNVWLLCASLCLDCTGAREVARSSQGTLSQLIDICTSCALASLRCANQPVANAIGQIVQNTIRSGCTSSHTSDSGGSCHRSRSVLSLFACGGIIDLTLLTIRYWGARYHRNAVSAGGVRWSVRYERQLLCSVRVVQLVGTMSPRVDLA